MQPFASQLPEMVLTPLRADSEEDLHVVLGSVGHSLTVARRSSLQHGSTVYRTDPFTVYCHVGYSFAFPHKIVLLN